MDLLLPPLNSSAIAGLAFALLLSLCCLLWRSLTPKSKSPPEAAGAWPVVGHLHLLRGPQLPHITLGAMADKLGPIFTIRLGLHKSVVVSSWDIAKECFTTHDSAVSSRPKFTAAKHLGYDYAMFGFSPYGPYWRDLRKLVMVELLGPRQLELLRHVRLSETEIAVKELYKMWVERKDASGRVLVEMKQWFSDLTLNVVVRMVAGKRYFGSGAESSDKEEARRCQRAFRKFFHSVGVTVISDAIPFLRWLDFWGLEKAMKETGKEMDSILEGWLEDHRRKRHSSEVGGDHDFMDVMLSKLESARLAGYDVDTVNKATCLALIIGGTDTNAVMLTWALSLLLNNPRVIKKVQEELDIHVGKQRHVNESDISNLVYLQAIVKETLRLYPAGPLGGLREFTEDCHVNGFYISKGTRLTLNLWKLQRDPAVWPSPNEFLPERFLTTHKNVDVKGQSFELIPFGAGRRVCPGLHFGVQVLHLVLARLLHGFEFSTPANAPVDMTESAGLTNMKVTPLEVLVAPRLATTLYY